jgi:NADH-quinone oxidoreductase subunit J
LDQIINPVLLYVCLAVGALGVAIALPRKGLSPQIIGGLIAGVGFGVVLVLLGLRGAEADGDLPNAYFYVFALIALLSGLRVITHPKPVYAAIYFILTILSSSALYLLMQAEFMAFALIIIYAGAILITYLFVIMLATQAPTEGDVEALSAYDVEAREPMTAVLAGFALLAVLTGMLATGTTELDRDRAVATTAKPLIEKMPRKVVRELEHAGMFANDAVEEPTFEELPTRADYDTGTIILTVNDSMPLLTKASVDPRFAALFPALDGLDGEQIEDLFESNPNAMDGETLVRLPESVRVTNAEGVGFTLIALHPMALELAGVILLMAMLGAVVLARKQIEIGEEEKLEQARRLAGPPASGDGESTTMGGPA